MDIEQLRKDLFEIIERDLYTIVQVAPLIGLSRPTVMKFLKGNGIPSMVTISKIKKFIRNKSTLWN